MIIGFAIRAKTSQLKYSPEGNELSRVRLGGTNFGVEIVSSPEKTALGLSGRESICEKCGMLFIFEGVAYRSFWMKDMKFDLDMVYISGDKIVYIAKNVRHENGTKEVVQPDAKADKILEVNAGTSDKFGLKVGDMIGL
jgi:uncharacterized membrane protein (UPF0127 family)